MQETIVLYPAPGIGHIVSMVELGKLLLRSHGYSITILLTTGFDDKPSTDTYIRRISQSHPSISFRRFPHVSIDSTRARTRSRAAKAFEFVRLNAANVSSDLKEISETSKIRAFVIDLFCTSALGIGFAMGIPVYYFFTSGAAVLTTFLYFPKIHEQTSDSFKDLAFELHFPGVSPLKAFHMPEPMLDRDDPAYWDMVYFCTLLPKSSGIIVNTFEELEPIAVQALAEGLCFPDPKQAPPVYYIGPLIADANDRTDGDTDSNNCLSWLDEQPRSSVLYLCFGSRGSFSVAQLKEIADGLERSGQRFLWVVKRPPIDDGAKQTEDTTGEFDLHSVLPSGFLERTKDRGMVVRSWAPQVEVLSRESVGGFVTHCGWNSVLEAVVAGVPMIAWPLYSEQHLNRNVLVEDMKMAIQVEQREEDGFVSGEELDRRARELMEPESEKGREMRERSSKMRNIAMSAIGGFGSSTRALALLVQTWNQ